MITTIATDKCSEIIFIGFSFCKIANLKLSHVSMERPQKIFMTIANDVSKNKTGITKVKANKNFAKKVKTVESQISWWECWFSDSSEIWIPNASEKASAMAMVKIPPITTSRELLAELRPTIKPRVVIVADVSPKLTPVLRDSSIFLFFNLINIIILL